MTSLDRIFYTGMAGIFAFGIAATIADAVMAKPDLADLFAVGILASLMLSVASILWGLIR